ncbi:MAG: hypothetical protein KAI59_02650, partial [Planctomycetes bacterium]|nr:hypothetical protein [Planctomycetota bacterium]
MTNYKKNLTTTTTLEFLQDQDPLFLIHTNVSDKLLGDHKHGSLCVGGSANKISINSGVKSKLFEISCIETKEEFEAWPEALSFYNYYGNFDRDEAAMIRPFRFATANGFILLENLFGTHTTLKFNPQFRRWARCKFSKLFTVANTLNDILIVKLLEHDYLSFHSACVEIDGKAFLFAGLPDTGKTYSTIQLISKGANFMSEDISLVNKKMEVTGLPFTATMEKRKKTGLLQKLRAGLYQTIYKQNFSKQTFIDTEHYSGQNICPRAPLAGVFFLSRGPKSSKPANSKQILTDLINLQNLEF